ncbi:hypothetical protein FHS59_003669 [Algoriphagus iocasae]|uniref:Uncharacterized protein n=1 Tax=Algoriphagus iocasae TaxID=1836499 RepID=A0A841MVC8_9BACT|nr:hypothetical protein [Algoriphagus iocasae]
MIVVFFVFTYIGFDFLFKIAQRNLLAFINFLRRDDF